MLFKKNNYEIIVNLYKTEMSNKYSLKLSAMKIIKYIR